jgi:hypothetical protein
VQLFVADEHRALIVVRRVFVPVIVVQRVIHVVDARGRMPVDADDG